MDGGGFDRRVPCRGRGVWVHAVGVRRVGDELRPHRPRGAGGEAVSEVKRYWTEAWCLNSPENRESIDDTEVVLASDYDALVEGTKILADQALHLREQLDAVVAERDLAESRLRVTDEVNAKLRAVVEAAKAVSVRGDVDDFLALDAALKEAE